MSPLAFFTFKEQLSNYTYVSEVYKEQANLSPQSQTQYNLIFRSIMVQTIVVTTLIFWLTYSRTFSQQIPQTIHYSNPATLAVPKGYTQLVEIDLGTARMILISGQVAQDSAGNIVGKGNPKTQFEQIFRNLDLAVKSVHGTMKNVVKLTYYLRDIAHLPAVREARDKYINSQHPPTSTAVEVSNLFRPDFLGEVEATVIIPKGKQ